jgi:formylglycine-generating enzyme required for sulfatase activity
LAFVFWCQAADADRGEKILKKFIDEFIPVTPGKGKFPASFTMGTAGEDAAASETPAVVIKLTQPFAMARHEVTQELYQLVMGKNPSKWKGPRNSVEMTNWNDAAAFCEKATALLHKRKLLPAKEEIRLPTEAEWEYVCRAGTKTRYSFGDKEKDLGIYGWFTGNAKGNDPPVGAKKANPWGFYDMHGYVWEWCADSWSPTHKGAGKTGSARVVKGEKARVIRGGSWAVVAERCTSTAREGKAADFRSDAIGFRCVRAAKPR